MLLTQKGDVIMAYHQNKYYTIRYYEQEEGIVTKMLEEYTAILNDKRPFMKYSEKMTIMDMLEKIYDFADKGYLWVNLNNLKKISSNKDIPELIQLSKEAIKKASELEAKNKENKND